MTEWRTFKPDPSTFESMERYENYRESVVCAICHERLKRGDEFDLRPLQTPEEAGGLTVAAAIVHRKCVETKT